MPIGIDILRGLVSSELADIRAAGRQRRLAVNPPGLIDLTRNDYLNLREDAHFQGLLRERLGGLPAGAGASRLLGGEHPIFAELERAFARRKGSEAALFFPSGYAANEAVMAAVARPGCRLFSDRLNHASIIDGMRLCGRPREDRVVFPHGDVDALEALLQRSPAACNVVVTESLFSMDGDLADLARLRALCRRHRGVLVVDEAHSLGCYGAEGQGLCAGDPGLVTVNPCGKSLAGQGAVVCGPAWLREYLINTARTFIFTTGPSPWMGAALLCALDYVGGLRHQRRRLHQVAAELRDYLRGRGFDIGQSQSHIIPVICGEERAALAMSRRLQEAGVLVHAVRPPTVPPGTSRLRLSLHAGLDEEAVARICAAFAQVGP